MNNLTAKTIWLTGASSGIGNALAIRLAEMGNFVIVSARRKELLQELALRFPKQIHVLPMDVSDTQQRATIINQLKVITDSIDTLIMAAGVAEYEDDLTFNSDIYQRSFDVNFMGVVNAVAIALPFLKCAQQKAHIVGISSLSVVVGMPRAEAYGASKAAMEYFLNALRVDLSPRKFDVTIVRPGFVTTPMTAQNDFPMPFEMPPNEACERIIKGLADRPRLLSFPYRLTGVLHVMSFLSGVWYKYLGPKMSRNRL